MSWKSRFQQASFRGVRFYVSNAASEFGRKKVVHEFPFRDIPYTEDLGRRAKRFPLQGFLVGQDYNFSRDLLIRAVEKEGPGQLVHPYLGIKDVECLNLKVTENFDEGGYARLEFEFVEAGKPLYPSRFFDQVLATIERAEALLEEAALLFLQAFSVLSAPAYIVQSAANLVDKFGSAILSQNGLGAVQGTAGDLAESIHLLKREAAELVSSPRTLADRTKLALRKLGDSFSTKSDAVRSLARLSEIKAQSSPPLFPTRNRKREQANESAFTMLIKLQAISLSSIFLSELVQEPEAEGGILSSQDVLTLRNQILQAIDEYLVMEDIKEPQNFQVITAVKTQLTKAIPSSVNLPAISKVELDEPMSSFTLAYRLYGNISREADLIARNNIENPVLIPQGKVIEYVS